MTVLLVLLLTFVRPDRVITPGSLRQVGISEVCSTQWSKADKRHVTDAMKRRVAIAYGVPWSTHRAYAFDHLIPRELGGADTESNLWPQPLADAKRKDQEEHRLHRAVCRGTLGLTEAQEQMRHWGQP